MHIEDTVAVLGEIELFADFTREQLRMLAFVAEDRVLRPGEVLYHAGDAARGGYVLSAGTLVASEDPAEPKGYTIRPPALVGEFGLMLTRPRGVTLVARDRVELVFISREAFLKLLRNEPELAGAVSERLRAGLVRYLDAVTRSGSRFAADPG